MNKYYKLSKMVALTLGILIISSIAYFQLPDSEVAHVTLKTQKTKAVKKPLLVNGHRYDGPEKFA
jgi:hypothetical protein